MSLLGKIGVCHPYVPIPSPPEVLSLWSSIWRTGSLPKVNILCWNLAHGKVLMGGNLKRRGLMGPFRCALCCQEEEFLDHLFLGCPYARNVWSQSLLTLRLLINWPSSVTHLFNRWRSSYQGTLKTKPTLKLYFQDVPKYVTWKIWLARNRAIFS
jgi:hypothetical protein